MKDILEKCLKSRSSDTHSVKIGFHLSSSTDVDKFEEYLQKLENERTNE